jgi:hypothetical protein
VSVIRVVGVDRERGVVTVEEVDGDPNVGPVPLTLRWPSDAWRFHPGQQWADPEWGHVVFPDVYEPHKSKITKQLREVACHVAPKADEGGAGRRRYARGRAVGVNMNRMCK